MGDHNDFIVQEETWLHNLYSRISDFSVKIFVIYKDETVGAATGFILAKHDDAVLVATAGHNFEKMIIGTPCIIGVRFSNAQSICGILLTPLEHLSSEVAVVYARHQFVAHYHYPNLRNEVCFPGMPVYFASFPYNSSSITHISGKLSCANIKSQDAGFKMPYYLRLMQFCLSAARGSSGGAIFDRNGCVVAVLIGANEDDIAGNIVYGVPIRYYWEEIDYLCNHAGIPRYDDNFLRTRNYIESLENDVESGLIGRSVMRRVRLLEERSSQFSSCSSSSHLRNFTWQLAEDADVAGIWLASTHLSKKSAQHVMVKRLEYNGIKVDSDVCHQGRGLSTKGTRHPHVTEEQIAQECPICLWNCKSKGIIESESEPGKAICKASESVW